MGDYGNRLQLNANGGMFQTELSNEYSINGDYSAKILFTGSGYVRYRLYEGHPDLGHSKETDRLWEWK